MAFLGEQKNTHNYVETNFNMSSSIKQFLTHQCLGITSPPTPHFLFPVLSPLIVVFWLSWRHIQTLGRVLTSSLSHLNSWWWWPAALRPILDHCQDWNDYVQASKNAWTLQVWQWSQSTDLQVEPTLTSVWWSSSLRSLWLWLQLTDLQVEPTLTSMWQSSSLWRLW